MVDAFTMGNSSLSVARFLVTCRFRVLPNVLSIIQR